jgi:hypothetical protein
VYASLKKKRTVGERVGKQRERGGREREKIQVGREERERERERERGNLENK